MEIQPEGRLEGMPTVREDSEERFVQPCVTIDVPTPKNDLSEEKDITQLQVGTTLRGSVGRRITFASARLSQMIHYSC